MPLKNSYGQTNSNSPSTGEKQDTLVQVPISTIRRASIKLLEAKKNEKILSQKDSIISDYKQLVLNREDNIQFLTYKISTLNDDIAKQQDINKQLEKSLKTQKHKTVFAAAAGSAAAIVATIFILRK